MFSNTVSMSYLQMLVLMLKIAGLTGVLLVLSAIGSTLLPAAGGASTADDLPAPEAPSGSFVILLLMILAFQVVALAWPILRSRWHGWQLLVTVFVLHFGTVTFLNQIESWIYLRRQVPGGFVPGLIAMGLFTAILFAPIAVLVLGRWRASSGHAEGSRPPDPGGLYRRLAVAGATFVALYYLFGYYVAWQSPELRAFYGGTDPGSFLAQMSGIVRTTPWMLPVQFARGLGWAALGYLMSRSMNGRWWEKGLATALLFALPCFYLLLPNPIMPDVVTWRHFLETLPYQVAFGFFLGWLFRGANSGRPSRRLGDARQPRQRVRIEVDAEP